MKSLVAGIALVLLAALPAGAQQAPPPQPAQPVEPQPDWYVQKKCPDYVDCMPTWDKGRAERCKWVKEHCPDTKIAY